MNDVLPIIFKLFSLPKDLKSLLNASLVCKQWHYVIRNEQLWKIFCEENNWLSTNIDDLIPYLNLPWIDANTMLDEDVLDSINDSFYLHYKHFYSIKFPICLNQKPYIECTESAVSHLS